MGKFKVGDRVRLIKSGEYNGFGKYGKTGEEGVVESLDAHDGTYKVAFADCGKTWWAEPGNLELVEQPWQPKVGDRVRFTTTAPAYNAKYSPNGLTIASIEAPNKDGTINVSVLYDDECYRQFCALGDIEPLPTTPTFTIEPGKFYKTRDGRKVGPMCRAGSGERYWLATEALLEGYSSYWCENGSFYEGREYRHDLVAEWIDAPVAPASNDNAAPAKPRFKVGDWVKIIHTDYEGELPVGGVHRVEKSDDDGFELKSPVGLLYFRHSEAVPAPAVPTPTAIVALIEDGQPKPSARPFVHATEEAARAEADRLAGKHKGQQFGVYVLTTTSKEAAPTYKHEWQRLAANGEKINAIKELRAVTGMQLKPAKYVVEHFVEYPYGAAA